MTDANVQVRRATIEDIPQLTALCRQENLSIAELEKRFKEFQVVQADDGQLLGTVGLQISGNQGRLHSEALLHPEQADALRQKLWDRISLVAQNFGLVRVWIETSAPFWQHNVGFGPAGAETLAKLPPDFGPATRGWSVLQLREEAAGPSATSIDKEFALFREAERERTQKIFRQARVLKMVASVIAIAVFGLALVWAVMFYKKYRAQRQQP